ncbi:ABC transporter permease [Magnetovibrio sp.]|uniref:ABC transporter permease n=1 Tax=Magnetovibrio sp. TaxID=2024836 RepID=UPI002F95676A
MSEQTANGWLRRVLIVVTKELRDHSRDRRSLMLALIYPMLGPLLVAGGLFLAGKTLQGDFREHFVTVPAVGIEHAPELKAYLEDNNVRFSAAPLSRQEQEAAVRDGRLPVVMIVPDAAADRDTFTVELITNTGRVDNLRVTSRLSWIVRGFNDRVADEKALAAGLPEGYATPVKIERVNVARDANIAVFFYNMVPPLVIFMIFLGGVHLAIDTTVGERERGSLEPLLLAPVERWVLLLAKALAALAFTAVTTVVNLGAFRLFMGLAASSSERLVAPPGWDVFVLIFAVTVPLMAIAVALQMSVAVITRSMKEAQIYLGLLPLVPALPGMVMVFSPMNPTDATVAVPVLGQMLLINQLVAEQSLDPQHVMIATLTTTVSAALIFLLAAKWFRREKMFVLG